MTRRFGLVVSAKQVQSFGESYISHMQQRQEIQQQALDIKTKLSTHEGELQYLRERMFEMFNSEDLTTREKLEVAREIRQNISAVQGMAKMSDEQGEFTVVINVSDMPQAGKVIENGTE